ncbi:MAG: thioredoxin domain-containing protein [Bacteroidales bacterium]|nr:thioredoxin domain-containing protein [Bacteroidales bacterium]
MFFASASEDNLISVVYRALSYYKVRITYGSVRRYLKPHHDYPSLKSVCDLFKYINVTYYPLRVDAEELLNIDRPFISHLKQGSGRIILVYEVSKDSILYTDSGKNKKQIETSRFFEDWSGVAVLLEPCERAGEKEYRDKRNHEHLLGALVPLLIIITFLTCITGFFDQYNYVGQLRLDFFVLIFTKSVGFLLSILLLLQELKIDIGLTDKLCHLSTHVDCDAVTRSNASKVFGTISWADIGITYFLGGLALLCLLPFKETESVYAILSVAALPYPVFSVLYQWLKVKKWCPFCLLVQMVIVVEFVFLFRRISFSTLVINTVLTPLAIFGTVFIVITLIKTLFLTLQQEEANFIGMMKLKRDPVIFFSRLQKMPVIDVPLNQYSLVLGDLNRNVTITIFLSFYCTFCAKSFKSVKLMIEKGANIKIQLIFSPSNDDSSVGLAKTLCMLIGKPDQLPIIEILDKWYSADFKVKQSIIEEMRSLKDSDYCHNFASYNNGLFQEYNISAVPAIFVNGYRLPASYKLEDIEYFADELESSVTVKEDIIE